MRITNLDTVSAPSLAAWRFDGIEAGLNVFHGPPRCGKSALARFIAGTLFGATNLVAGSPDHLGGRVDVVDGQRRFCLQRSASADSRLWIKPFDGEGGEVITLLQTEQYAAALARIHTIDFFAAPDPGALISQWWSSARASEEDRWGCCGCECVQPSRGLIQISDHAFAARASQYIRQVLGGRFTHLQMGADPRQLWVIESGGRAVPLDALDAAARDQVSLCCHLTVARTCREHNVLLPLIIDAPFIRQDPHQAAKIAALIGNFAGEGHQVLLFTSNCEVARWCRHNGAAVRYLAACRPVAGWRETAPEFTTTFGEPVYYGSSEEAYSEWETDSSATETVFFPKTEPPESLARESSDTKNIRQLREHGARHHIATKSADSPTQRWDISGSQKPARIFYLSPKDGIDSATFIPERHRTALSRTNVGSVHDLLNQDADRLAAGLGDTTVRPSHVRAWQDQALLICYVPGLRPRDAQVLWACGARSPEELSTADADLLWARIRQFFQGRREPRSRSFAERYDRERLANWIRGARRGQRRWRKSQYYQRWSQRDRPIHPDRATSQRPSTSRRFTNRPAVSQRASYAADPDHADGDTTDHEHATPERTVRKRRRLVARVNREPRPSRQPRQRREPLSQRPSRPPRELLNGEGSANGHGGFDHGEGRRSSKKGETNDRAARPTPEGAHPLRFYLETSSPVEDAPSIGKKTAERLARTGVHTVDDLLQADPEQVASQMANRRVSAATVTVWQQQARLVCSIPQLRGHDAQILVACDITEPQQLAGMDAGRLFAVVGPFSESKKGVRIIRAGKKPDLAEVTDWIQWASQSRTLKAA